MTGPGEGLGHPLRDLYSAVNNYGSITIDHHQNGADTMSINASNAVASHLSEKIDAAEYVEYHPGGESERRRLLESIDSSLKSGKYVIIDVSSDPKGPIKDEHGNPIGHRLVITHSDSDGGWLQVVNPGWGFAKQVSYDDFIRNHLGSLTNKEANGYGDGLSIVSVVALPE